MTKKTEVIEAAAELTVPSTAVQILMYALNRRDHEEPEGIDKHFTIDEVREATGLHKSTYKKGLKCLYVKGWIEKIEGDRPAGAVEWRCSEMTEHD